MMDSMLTWLLFGFFIGLFVKFLYISPGRTSFSQFFLMGTMGAASGDIMSKALNASNAFIYVSPVVYMMAGAIILVIWSIGNKVAS